jgi:hypothetical protein
MVEAFVCDYVRTPIGRFGGALAAVAGLGTALSSVPRGCHEARFRSAQESSTNSPDVAFLSRTTASETVVSRMSPAGLMS